MAKELPYFKFEPAEWKFGRIQRCTDKVKATFIDLMCAYWHKNCEMTVSDAELDFGSDEVFELINKQIITKSNESIKIKFLDVQMAELLKKKEIASAGGKKSAQSRLKGASSEVEVGLNGASSALQHIRREEIREEENREETLYKDLEQKKVTTKKEKIKGIYRQIKHLTLTDIEAKELIDIYTKKKLDAVLDALENRSDIDKYASAHITAKQWLQKNKDIEDKKKGVVSGIQFFQKSTPD